MFRRPIRIGNCSGIINDGIDQIYRLAKHGQVDAITADYLAEFNIAWKAIELQTDPTLGYEPNFLEQIAWHNGDAARLVAEKRIKIVHDGGALNPRGLVEKTDAYLQSIGIHNLKVAWVSGDDVTEKNEKLLAANVYIGYAGIVRALAEGADIVICGRCTDASPVMGLAAWWHGWRTTDYDALAGSLMAGHLIECGPYVTGGNYCGQREIRDMQRLGWPIAEIDSAGGVVITKPEGSNGIVTVDTCKAQLLYEIQGPIYLKPDVIADNHGVNLTQIGTDRVRLSNIKGLPPPPTAKLAFNVLKTQVLKTIDRSAFTTFTIEKYGTAQHDPRSQAAATVQFRIFAQGTRAEAFDDFKRAVFYNGPQGFCGFHAGMDWRTMVPRPYVKYFPALVQQDKVPMVVHFIDGKKDAAFIPARDAKDCGQVPTQPTDEPKRAASSSMMGKIFPPGMTRRPLGDLVLARSGDKGGNANIGFWVRDESAYAWLQGYLTSQRVKELLGDDWDARYQIERCEFVNLQAVHFVIKGILQDGVSSSNVLDGFAKSMGEFVRARVIEMPTELVQKEAERNVSGSCRPAKIANPIGVPKDSLHFLYELHPAFAAFPTFPINLAFKQTDQDIFDFIARTTTGGVPGVPPFDAQRSVDGERAITVLRQLPVSSDGLDVEVRGRVIGVYDKGGAMILEAEQTLVDANTGVEYTKMASTAFGISQDGYGGPRRPTKSAVSIPATTPDAVHVYYTTETTALLYRLCGDYNPMHADEEFGKRAGFQGSILHGLGTWNMAAQGLLREMGGSDPRRFKSFGARFKSVVYPGDTLVTRMWRVGNEGNFDLIVFETVVKEDGRVAFVGETVQLSFNVAIGELVPNKYRPMVLSFVFLTNAPIATFGPIIARKFVNTPSLGWRWCFYINIICVGLTIILLYCFYHPPTVDLLHERKTNRQPMREHDYLGIFLWTAGLTLFLMGVSWGGNMYPWKSAATISSLAIGGSLLVALFFWEGYADLKYPAIPIKFFLNRGWFSLMFYYSAVLLWPQQVQALYTRYITYAGWLSTTVASSTALGQIVAGAIVKWGGNVRYWIIFSTFAMVGFVGALASLTPETKNTGIALTIIGPFFVGFIELAALALAPLYCKPADIGLASGLLASIRSAGGSIAVTVYTTILANQLSTTIPSNIARPAIEAGLPADQVGALAAAVRAGKLATFPGITDSIQDAVRSVLLVAYSQAFKTVYLASLGFGGIAIVGCLFSKDVQKHLTDRVERRMGDGKRKPELAAKTVDDDPRRESREIQEGA
ncbi:hypothetical protein BN1708_001955 [Verticillium longisporum]|uniref:Uncharacterized protein n=1 Tax=Verticillium longisporum TaxID=100787 RepID=A0A0G4KDC8_VERLO|nr:hypothetical protein BN1708_001955 [Verticillium longisporum]